MCYMKNIQGSTDPSLLITLISSATPNSGFLFVSNHDYVYVNT